jgi:ferritin
MSSEEEDWATWNFMQWFVKEQVEEETFALELLDKMKIAGGEKISSADLYAFDRDMENTADEARAAQDVTVEHP